MERYNPFAAQELVEPDQIYTTTSSLSLNRQAELDRLRSLDQEAENLLEAKRKLIASRALKSSDSSDERAHQATGSISKYSTSFPDPFGAEEALRLEREAAERAIKKNIEGTTTTSSHSASASTSKSIDENDINSNQVGFRGGSFRQQRQNRGFGSFLSRATSVTSSTVTDRFGEAVGSARSALDSISSQISQAVPINQFNERLSSTATNLIESGDQLQQQVAAKLSFASNPIISPSANSQSQSSQQQQPSSMPVISRQRVILILDDQRSSPDWTQEFNAYHKLTSGATTSNSISQSVLSSLFSSSMSGQLEGADVIEQADFRDVSVLANQSSSAATVLIRNSGNRPSSGPQASPSRGFSLTGSSQQLANLTGAASSIIGAGSAIGSGGSIGSGNHKLIRPEYVVVRQRVLDELDFGQQQHLRGLVQALNYCLIPLFEPVEVWLAFQDRQFIFSKLLRVQRQLGKEQFPLIPQVFCQTHLDLLQYINSQSTIIQYPCLVRIGSMGKGKVKIESAQMFRDFVSVLASSKLSCTIEPYLNVKCDLIVQKFGTSLKLFKRNIINNTGELTTTEQQQPFQSPSGRLIGANAGQSASSSFERISSEVSNRHKRWVDVITREFDGKIEALSIKMVVGNDDREYIVGLTNCCMNFLGGPANQEEDRRSFVELVISSMNTILPKSPNCITSIPKRSSGDPTAAAPSQFASALKDGDKRKFTSQLDMSELGQQVDQVGPTVATRSQSVSVNDLNPIEQSSGSISSSAASRGFFNRRSSERGSQEEAPGCQEQVGGANVAANGSYTRRSSISQSLLDQTSTAFSSLQRQSMSLLKRLDSSRGIGSDFGSMPATPPTPQSAKSDRSFSGKSQAAQGHQLEQTGRGASSQTTKAQSMDSSSDPFVRSQELPPKPPPPRPGALANRQSSLASGTSIRTSAATPNSSRQSSFQSGAEQAAFQSSQVNNSQQQIRTKVVRQNSALSAFQAFDSQPSATIGEPSTAIRQPSVARLSGSAKGTANFDTTSITSAGSSNSTGEQSTAAEDTMNNLKKTFASIFGDKCE